MITYTTSDTSSDLEGILGLQKSNLRKGLTAHEIESQGFVTVDHTYEILEDLNKHERHIIAKDKSKVIGYVLAMTKHSKFDIPILLPMFQEFDKTFYKEKFISDYNYIIVGQVCVDKNYRGKGIFDNCYNSYMNHYRGKYDFAITEIASTNLRSLNAHKRIGFEEVHSYFGPDNTEWIIVIWDWKNVS